MTTTIFFITSGNNSTCSEFEFKCNNPVSGAVQKCIRRDLVCNKVPDCPNGSDEPLHCGVNECARVEDNQCGHKCVDTAESYKCECNPGYKLMPDGKACADVNECEEIPGMIRS